MFMNLFFIGFSYAIAVNQLGTSVVRRLDQKRQRSRCNKQAARVDESSSQKIFS